MTEREVLDHLKSIRKKYPIMSRDELTAIKKAQGAVKMRIPKPPEVMVWDNWEPYICNCPWCGERIEETKFCPYCGGAVEWKLAGKDIWEDAE